MKQSRQLDRWCIFSFEDGRSESKLGGTDVLAGKATYLTMVLHAVLLSAQLSFKFIHISAPATYILACFWFRITAYNGACICVKSVGLALGAAAMRVMTHDAPLIVGPPLAAGLGSRHMS